MDHRSWSKLNLVDVVVVAERAVLPIWEVGSSAIPDRIAADNFRVIVPTRDLSLFEIASDHRFSVESEDEYTQQFSVDLRSAIGETNEDRYGWYLQQLVKIEALRRLAEDGSAGIIWDADTIPLKPITFFTDEKTKLFKSTEYHLPYFDQIDRLLGLDKIVPHSFVAQCFPCRPEWVSAFVGHIEIRHGIPWWKAIINSIDFSERSGFSEYEALGTFISHYFRSEWDWSDEGWTRDGYAKFGDPRRALRLGESGRAPLLFAAFESWKIGNKKTALKGLRNFLVAIKKVKSHLSFLSHADANTPGQFETTLKAIMDNPSLTGVVQIGANDGIQNDFLRPFLTSYRGLDVTLVEPSPEYFTKLNTLYSDRSDVQLVNAACGATAGELELWELPHETAKQMNGNGPPNDWAMGQGSRSRATVVYWIWQNSFRGSSYTERIPEWIGAIKKSVVPTLLTDQVMPITDGDVLLVVDVQGMELEVLLGLSLARLPRWIVVEEDCGDTMARNYLLSHGYQLLVEGPNLILERKVEENSP